MNISNPIQSKAEWDLFIRRIKERKTWVKSDDEPTEYPVICIVNDEYDFHYAQNFTVYDFVYLEDFIRHDDELLKKITERNRLETLERELES